LRDQLNPVSSESCITLNKQAKTILDRTSLSKQTLLFGKRLEILDFPGASILTADIKTNVEMSMEFV